MQLQGKHIVVLVEDFYEDLELWYPVLRMREAGADVKIVGPAAGEEYSSKHGYAATADATPSDIDPSEVDALIVPGGYAPDLMRRHGDMVQLVRDVNGQGKVVAFICHGGWIPISAGIVKDRKATSFFSIKDDMVNAGVEWVDEEVVHDSNLISSRNPDDLPAFCRAIIEALS